jgi:hypothetical protein
MGKPDDIDYFRPPRSEEESTLMGIKGEFRRNMVAQAIADDGIESIPDIWRAPGLDERFKGFLQSQHPQNRGGEDLEDVLDGEVEIARVILLDAVHGEVTSLRARPATAGVGAKILLRMVDEYQTEIELPSEQADAVLSTGEVVAMFRDSEPSVAGTGCQLGFQSFFYPDLDEAAAEAGLK